MPAARNSRRLRSDEAASLARELIGTRQLLIASNRGPVQFSIDRKSGNLRRQRGAGGVVTALSALGQYVGIRWASCTMGEGDRQAVEQLGARIPAEGKGQPDLRFVCPSRDAYRKYYDVFSNPLLWFLHHYMWDPAYDPTIDARIYDAWTAGYVPVNQLFVDALTEELGEPEASRVVMLHDYHLYLVPGGLRERFPDLLLQQFVHIPWPDPAYWSLLPEVMRRPIFEGVAANDILGFQTQQSVINFLQGCSTFLKDADVDWRAASVRYRDHTVLARAYPISIDVQGLERSVKGAEVRRYVEKLQSLRGERATLVRVDRMEPSKNILRGFLAFDHLLARHRQYRGVLKFWAFLVPSRTNVPEYRAYAERVLQEIKRINARWGRPNWQPIELFYENNYAQAIAAMTLYDVLLVNPVVDGMNLVAKEGPTVNARDGVLILSEGAGAYDQLGDAALSVAPADSEGTTRALQQALTATPEERAERARTLRERVASEDIAQWLVSQLRDLAQLGAARAAP